MSVTLGQEIKRLRKERKITLRKLQEISGVSNAYLSQVETSQSKPSPDVLGKIADALNVSKLYLFKEAGYLDGTEILQLVNENKRLRETLEYYANKDIYFVSDDNAAEFDQGGKARKALKERGITDE